MRQQSDSKHGDPRHHHSSEIENLPDWMRRAARGLDWGLLIVVVLSLTVAAPFFFYDDLPHTNASENYVYRSSDYAKSIQEGVLYPRWSPHSLGGYGSPIPNFYPPATSYSAAVLQILFTNDAVSAVRLVYIFAICAAGAAVYQLVLRRVNAVAGVAAASLYLYSPYLGLEAPHILGDLPGVMTLGLLPFLLWAIDRLLTDNHPIDFGLVAISVCLLCLTSVTGLASGCLLGLLMVVWQRKEHPTQRVYATLAGGVLTGFGMAAFFWIPSILEQSEIVWRQMRSAPPYRLTFPDIFLPLHLLDSSQMIPLAQFTVGLPLVLATLISIIAIIILDRRPGFAGMFMTAGVVIGAIGVILLPSQTWLMGPITLCLAIGGSRVSELRWLVPTRLQRLFTPAILIVIWILSSGVWTPPKPYTSFGSTEPTAQVVYEQQGYGVAVLPNGDYVPYPARLNAEPSQFLLEGYQSNALTKLAPRSGAGSLQVGLLTHSNQSDVFQVRRISEATTLDILTAYFPGWQAEIGGRTLGLRPHPRTGLIQIDLPIMSGGNNELSVFFGTTDIRTGAWLISSVCLLILIIKTRGRYRRNPIRLSDSILLTTAESRLIGLPVLCFVIVAVFTIHPPDFIEHGTRNEGGFYNALQMEMRSDVGLTLNGFQLEQNVYRANEWVALDLYWQAQRFLTGDFEVTITLVNNQDGSEWPATSPRSPGYYPTKRWNTEQTLTDWHHFQLDAALPAGNYQIVIRVYECSQVCSDQRMVTFFGQTGQSLGTTLTLPTLITVEG